MKLGVIKKINLDDLGSDTPDAVKKMVTLINPFIEAMVNALEKRLTFDDNFLMKKIAITLTSGTEQKVFVGSQRVIGLLPVYAADKAIATHLLTYKSDGTVGITLTFTGGGSAACIVYLILG